MIQRMREHRYKAKRLDGQWVEGYYWQNGCGNHFIRVIDGQGEFVLLDAEIDPETLCEFTGLYDKNKNMIYEHDIVQSDYNYKQEVKYGIWNCGCCYDVYGWDILNNEDESLKVVGNIFDNPELLEVNK